MIVQQEKGAAGFVNFDSIYHEILPLNKDVSLLTYNNDTTDFPEMLCALDGLEADSTITTEFTCEDDGCAALITILVLLPQDAQDWLGNLDRPNIFLSSMVHKLNFTFQNSDIPHRARVVYENFDWDYDNDYLVDDVEDLMLNSSAISLREEHKADLVILLINHDYPNDDNRGAVAPLINDYGIGDELSFGIVQLPFVFWPYSIFTHEVGHLFGAQHQNSNIHREDCSVAWEVLEDKYYTVMHIEAPDPRVNKYSVLHFSNPDVDFFGWPTGSVDPPANNAGIIKETGCTVAGFEGDQDFVVMISGGNRLCSGVYTANVTPPMNGSTGTPPYTYEWRWNYDGLFSSANPGTLLQGSGDEIILSAPFLSSCSFFFIQVKVTSDDNLVSYATKRIAFPCSPCDLSEAKIGQNKTGSINDQNRIPYLEVFPNPNKSSHIEAIINDEDAIKVHIMLSNLAGIKLKEWQQDLAEGEKRLSLSLNESVPAGTYFLTVRTDNKTVSRKIIILK